MKSRVRRAWLVFAQLTLLGGLAAAALLGYLAYAPAGDARPHPFNQDRNAVWLEHRWLTRDHTDPEIEELVERLQRRGVRYVFPHIIPFDSAGNLPEHSRQQMRRFLAVAREAAPDMRILPWVGGLRLGYRRATAGSIDLGNLGQRQRLVAECRGLIDEGFHGVHINVEPIDDGNLEFLALLRALRTAVGEDHLLSIAATRPGPIAPPIAPNFFWTRDYYRSIAGIVDQLVVMTYDTAIPTPELYRRYLAYAAAATTRRLESSRARILIGVPTYDARGIMHRAGVETPENALLGVVAGLRGVGGGGTFEGVALYAEWTTDTAEWRIYDRIWRGRTQNAE